MHIANVAGCVLYNFSIEPAFWFDLLGEACKKRCAFVVVVSCGRPLSAAAGCQSRLGPRILFAVDIFLLLHNLVR